MSTTFEVPDRVAHQEQAKKMYPDELALLVPALHRSDLLADAAVAALDGLGGAAHAMIGRAIAGETDVPEALLALIETCRVTPDWVDWTRVDRAGALFFRAGILGGIVLGLRSLIYGYAAPVGNKPLAFTGALEQKAQRRLAETSKFVAAVCTQGELVAGRSGFAYCIFVRLMHAQVRAMALRDQRWDSERWGLPINQHDMLATILLFSIVFVDGLRIFGLYASAEEEEDFQHLWRLVGHYLGVEHGLLPTTVAQARKTSSFIRLTQGPADEDSRALARALINEPFRHAKNKTQVMLAKGHVMLARSLARALVDETTAQALGLGKGRSRLIASQLHTLMQVLEWFRRRSAPLDAWVNKTGARYWAFSGQVPDAHEGVFVMPRTLPGEPRGK